MTSVFKIYFEDALDHCNDTGDEFDTYEEAKKAFNECVKAGPEGYDLSVEITEVVGDYEDMITHDVHQWFTAEEWDAAHPSGYPD